MVIEVGNSHPVAPMRPLLQAEVQRSQQSDNGTNETLVAGSSDWQTSWRSKAQTLVQRSQQSNGSPHSRGALCKPDLV